MVRHDGCEAIITEGWKKDKITNFEELAKGVEQCGSLLTKWNKEVFENIQYYIKQKESELEKLLNGVIGTDDANAIDSCRRELHELSLKEEILWKQRSKTCG